MIYGIFPIEVYRGFGMLLRHSYLWLVGNRGMVVIVVIVVPHSSIPY